MKQSLIRVWPVVVLSALLPCAFVARANTVTVSYPDGPRTYSLTIETNKATLPPGGTAVFTANIAVREPRSEEFVKHPESVARIKWTAGSSRQSDLLKDRRVQLNRSGGTVTITNV